MFWGLQMRGCRPVARVQGPGPRASWPVIHLRSRVTGSLQ